MQITQHPASESMELRLIGRLDATWADHVSDSIETTVRAGWHRIVLNFAEVNYISSLGIAVLLKHYQRLKAVNGSLVICEPSTATLKILTAAKLTGFLVNERPSSTVAAAAARTLERATASFHAYPQTVATPLTCAAVGDPGKLAAGGLGGGDARTLSFATGTFGLGIGAFGEGFDDCRDRFGEFLAAGGCAITLPTNDLHALPDYVIEEGALVPRVETLYAITGAGDFPLMVRFDASPTGPGKVALSELLDAALELSQGEIVAFVVLSEAARLVGATLRRSPVAGPVSLDFPSVRDWVSFTTERNSERCLALLVGVAARNSPAQGAAFLRPMKDDGGLHAHVHAALFPFRPVQQGELPFGKTIGNLLTASPPSTVMHLMADTRPFEGVGETDLVRGACWLGALQDISRG
jgi:anti-anti-sigma factor